MKRFLTFVPVLTLGMLVGCQQTEEDSHRQSSNDVEVRDANIAQANADALKAADNADFRLLALANRVLVLPGVDLQKYSEHRLKQRCGIRVIDGGGDTLNIGQSTEPRKAPKNYAQAYNKAMLDMCLRFQKHPVD